MLLRHCNNNPQNGPTVVLAPTRELATQIQDEVIKFGQCIRISCTVGGSLGWGAIYATTKLLK
ncbi:putative RNA helicase [Helianthus annuus]|nr:putative RNA helicase [Helianthus annuus]